MVQTNELKAKVMDNPKLMGALWATVLLLTEVAPVLASHGTTEGP